MGAKNENRCSLELNNWQHQMLILNMNKNAKRYLKIMLDEMYNSYLNISDLENKWKKKQKL